MAEKISNKYVRLLKNIGMLLAGNFVTKVLSFLMVPFYTSILTTSDYGIADLISNIVLLALPLFSLLMDEAIMRFTLDKKLKRQDVFMIAFVLSTVGFLVAMCISPILLLFDPIKPYYWFVVLYYVVSWIYNLISNYVKGLDKLSITTIAGVIHTFTYLLLNIIFLAGLKIGIYGYLLAINLSNLVAIIFLFLSSKAYKNFVNLRNVDWSLAKRMVKYSLPMIPNYMSWWINNASDKFIISLYCGTAVNGVYSVAYKIPSLLNSVTTIFSSAWQISSVDNFGSEESINFYNKVYIFYSGILVIGGSGLILITKLLASFLFAKDFFVAWKITPILIMAYIFSALAQFLGSIFSASMKTATIFFSSLSGAIVNLTLNIILIPKYQGQGAAIATAIGYMTIWIVNMINARRFLPMNFNLKRIIPAIFLLIVEILAVLSDSIAGYILAAFCVGILLLSNRKEFKDAISLVIEKIHTKKKSGV